MTTAFLFQTESLQARNIKQAVNPQIVIDCLAIVSGFNLIDPQSNVHNTWLPHRRHLNRLKPLPPP